MAETQSIMMSKQSIVMVTGGSIRVSVEDEARDAHVLSTQAYKDDDDDDKFEKQVNESNTTSCMGNVEDQLESQQRGTRNEANSLPKKKTFLGKGITYWTLMALCSLMLLLGVSIATLLGRLYFIHGGSKRWLITCTQTAGWPILIPPLMLSRLYAPTKPRNDIISSNVNSTWVRPPRRHHTLKLTCVYIALGFLATIDNLLFSWGLSYLPVSTNALLSSSQLAFNAIFAYALIPRQRISSYTVNAIICITIAALLLGVHAGGDRPPNTTHLQYIFGFLFSLGASALYALLLPLIELTFNNFLDCTTFSSVLEVQTIIAFFATIFAILGMAFSGEFSSIIVEATSFPLGPSVYAFTIIGSTIGWQMFFLGTDGVIFLGSSLLSCVFGTAIFPLLSILAVIFFHDSFTSLKGISMLLAMWGFTSYIYGGYLEAKSQDVDNHEQTPSS